MKKPVAPKIVMQDPEILLPYNKNAKIHSPEQIKRIADQIEAFGFDQPIVVDEAGVIIKGHGRREAAILLGLKVVPTIVSTLSAEKARLSRIGDNKVAEAPWDTSMLRVEFEELKLEPLELVALTGFTVPEISEIQDGWVSNVSRVEKIAAHTDGISALIKVSCPQEMRAEVLALLKAAIDDSGFQGVELE